MDFQTEGADHDNSLRPERLESKVGTNLNEHNDI